MCGRIFKLYPKAGGRGSAVADASTGGADASGKAVSSASSGRANGLAPGPATAGRPDARAGGGRASRYPRGSQSSACGSAAFQKSQSWPPAISRCSTSMPVPRRRAASTRLGWASGSWLPQAMNTRGRGRSQ